MTSSGSFEKKSTGSFASAGKRFLKKLVYENYEEIQERRRSERQSVVGEAAVTITGPGGEALGETKVFIRDSSGAGCGLWSRVPMPVGSTVMITVSAGEGREGAQRLGRVRHCRGSSGSGFVVGVQFDSESGLLGRVA
ncbi:MAG: PilZ domain-containing protein [Phycisphaerales bacterium]